VSLLHSLLTGFYNDAKANQLNHYYEAKVPPVVCIAKDPKKKVQHTYYKGDLQSENFQTTDAT
jgi:hypothetical protein